MQSTNNCFMLTGINKLSGIFIKETLNTITLHNTIMKNKLNLCIYIMFISGIWFEWYMFWAWYGFKYPLSENGKTKWNENNRYLMSHLIIRFAI